LTQDDALYRFRLRALALAAKMSLSSQDDMLAVPLNVRSGALVPRPGETRRTELMHRMHLKGRLHPEHSKIAR
jgi:hypothetical protein